MRTLLVLKVASWETILKILLLPLGIVLEIHSYSKGATLFQKVESTNDATYFPVISNTKIHHINKSILMSALGKHRRIYNTRKEKYPLKELREKVYQTLNILEVMTPKHKHLINNNFNKNPSLIKWMEVLDNASDGLNKNKKNRGILNDSIDNIKANVSKDQNVDSESIQKILNDMENENDEFLRRDKILQAKVTKPKKKKIKKTDKKAKIQKLKKQDSDEFYENIDYSNELEEVNNKKENNINEENPFKVELNINDADNVGDINIVGADNEMVTNIDDSNTGDANTTSTDKKEKKEKKCSDRGASEAKHRTSTLTPDEKEKAELEKFKWQFIKDRIGYRKQTQSEEDEEKETEYPWKLQPNCCNCCNTSDFGCH